ncbi:MAG: hypothetical protein MRJ93_11515 [Nitrososphaeraceae archaeon]|nr:hypothetical protein [Nitrososphaeraceae archaeon]
MLGDLIYVGKGRITDTRVLNAEENKIEHTLIEDGKFKDIDVIMTITFWTITSGNKTIYGEAQGIITTKDLMDTATCKAYGIGRYSESGKTTFRATMFFKTTPNGKLSFLNNTIGLVESEVDSLQHLAKIWEWK